MASINEVYGKNYEQEASDSRMSRSAGLVANNIAGLNLSDRYDSSAMWEGDNMKAEAIQIILRQVRAANDKFYIYHVNKTSKNINMFPYLLNGPVEYFRVVDLERYRVYFIYVTPYNMEPF